MSAEYLRETARMMRATAGAATPGPWECLGDHLVWPSEKGPAANDPILAVMGEAHHDSAQHIAAWHPAVALAVADWLYQASMDLWAHGTDCYVDSHETCDECDDDLLAPHVRQALTVARAWRGDA